MAIAQLSIDLVAQLAKLQAGMDKAAVLAEKNAKVIADKYAAAGAIAAKLGVALTGAFSVAGLAAFVRTTADGLDALNDLSDATGASVERLSALEDVAARTGTSLDTVGSAIIKLNKTITEAKPGTEAAAALKAIGVSAQELRDLDPADALVRVAQGLAGVADDGNKARLTQELFGKSLREVAPLLKDLVEKGQLNATVTKEQAEAAERFKREIAEANKNLVDLARDIGSVVIPALNKLFERGRKEGWLSALFTPDDTEKARRAAESAAEDVRKVAAALDAALVRSNNTELPGSARAFWQLRANDLRAELERLQRAAVKASDAVKAAVGGAESERDKLRRLEGGVDAKPSAQIADVELAKRFDDFVERLQEAARGTVQLSEVERTRFALAQEKWAGLTEQQRAYLLDLARVKDLMAGFALPGANDDARDRFARQMQERADQLTELRRRASGDLQRSADEGGDTGNIIADVRGLAAASRDAQIERLSEQIASVREQMRIGGGNARDYQRALAQLGEQMRALEDNTKTFGEKLGQSNEAVRELGEDLQGAIGASLVAQMEGNSERIEDIWKGMLRRMLAQAASAALVRTALGENFTSKGEVGGWVGRLIGLVGGTGGSSSGGDASGIKVGGEFTTPQSGKASGSASTWSTSGGTTKAGAGVTQNIIVQGDASEKTIRLIRAAQAEQQANMANLARF